MAAFGGPVGGIDGERVLNFRNILLINRELLALGLVADQDRRAEGSLYAQKIVEVSFVGRENNVELRIFEIEPSEIALIVVV